MADRVQEDAATARTLLSGALVEELGRRVGDYENAITWNTSCTSCARTMDRAYDETMRAEAAEAKVAALRTILLEGGQDNATVRRRALAITGSDKEEPS